MRLALSGSQGVGKTTLLNLLQLEGHRNLPEVPRQVIYDFGKLPHHMTPQEFYDFQKEVARRQKVAEAGNNFIADRCLYDFLAYVQDLSDQQMIAELYQYVLEDLEPYDHIFYLPIEFPLEVDDVRKNSLDYQKIIDERLLKTLEDYQVNYHVITGTVPERLDKIYKIIRSA